MMHLTFLTKSCFNTFSCLGKDVRFVFSSNCLKEGSCRIYILCVCLPIVVCFLFCLSSPCVLCNHCCQFVWIDHFWLSLWHSLMFILTKFAIVFEEVLFLLRQYHVTSISVRVMRGTDVASDHHLVVANIKLKLKKSSTHVNVKRIRCW